MDDKKFVQFLLLAKRNTYAAIGDGASTVMPLLSGSHQLEYRDGDLLYRDVYFGGDFFAGQETVYWGERPFWSMVYAGGLLNNEVETAPLYNFLRVALQQVGAERPFRGPAHLAHGDYLYCDDGRGDIHRFEGVEIIRCQGRDVYRLAYSGGLIRE